MTRRRLNADAGSDLRRATDSFHVLERRDLLAQVRAFCQGRIVDEVRPVVLVHHVASLGKRSAPPDVVGVEVRVHDDVDVLGLHTGRRERVEQRRTGGRQEVPRLRADARVDQDGGSVAAQERAVHGHPPVHVGLDRRERLAQRRERAFAVGQNLRSHNGFLPANPSSTPCQ